MATSKPNDPAALFNLIRRIVSAGFSVSFGRDILRCLDGRIGGDHPLASRLQEARRLGEFDPKKQSEILDAAVCVARVGRDDGAMYGGGLGVGFGDTDFEALRYAIENAKRNASYDRAEAEKRLARLEEIKTEG